MRFIIVSIGVAFAIDTNHSPKFYCALKITENSIRECPSSRMRTNMAYMYASRPHHVLTLSKTMAPPVAGARMRGASSCPRRSCRPILCHLLLISLVCLKGTTTLAAASSIPPLSVLNSRRVSAGDAAASTASFARDRRLAPFLGSCRGGAAAAAAATPVETQKGVGPMEIFLHTIKEARRHLAAAAVARSVSIFGMCEFMAT